jgi:hypothetical protein
LALLIVTAYIGATVFPAAPVFAASADKNGSSMNGMMHKQDGQDHKMPCKGMLPGCVTDLGCVFLVSLPVPNVTLFTVTGWSSVLYTGSSQSLRGARSSPL